MADPLTNSILGSKLPNTTVRTDHAISISVGGMKVGMIQDWSPNQARNMTALYEINSAGLGEVYEQVPGTATGQTISVNRFDLFKTKMEQAWGLGFDIQRLTDQTNPLTIKEIWKKPTWLKNEEDNIFGIPASETAVGQLRRAFGPRFGSYTEIWVYTGCWFSSLGRTHSANGDRITKVNATLNYTNKYRAA